MKIAIDACTAILLAKSSVIESLANVVEVKMTEQVYNEVIKGKEKMLEDSFLIENLKTSNKIQIIRGNGKITEKLMRDFNMGEGEASTISAGMGKKFIIATDNLQGRKASKVNSLPLVGSLELITHLFRTGEITSEKAMNALKKLKKYGWFEDNLIEIILEDLKNDKG
ncbi:hypothetical protein HYT57_03070 [Candidatus Woesearchaeota archaeon]|nr:hypothetical protein [Candidatus Woesearchaeota archaeon]